MLLKSLPLIAALFLSVGCYGYRELPLSEQITVVEKTRDVEFQAAKKLQPNGVINEAAAIQLALSFNPNIRIPLIHERGWGEADVQFREAIKPELRVDDESGTLGLNVDMFGLFKLLSHTERVAWRNERAAERLQATSEQKGALIKLKRDVKLSFLNLGKVSSQLVVLKKQMEYVKNYKLKMAKKIDTVNEVLFNLHETELQEKIRLLDEEMSRTNLVLLRLIGANDLTSKEIHFDFRNVLAISNDMPTLDAIRNKIISAKATNWLLTSLSANYVQKEYVLREAYLRRFGTFSIGPSVTKNPDGFSYGMSFHVRVPWPSKSDDAIQDATDERLYAAAKYTAAMHDLEADVAKQYDVMQHKWENIKNHLAIEEICQSLESETGDNIHSYLDIVNRLFQQSNKQIDDISHFKMSEIILESLL